MEFNFTQVIASIIIMLFGILVGAQIAPIMSWAERRQCAFTQRRLGPNRVGIFKFNVFGLGQPIADAMKLLFKEDFVPPYVHKVFYVLAPVITVMMGLTVTALVPWGNVLYIGNETVRLQAVHENTGFLMIFAIAALSVYGVTLAGWSSNNKYSLLGGLRASAQMISYEVSMALSLIPLLLLYNTFELQKIVALQTGTLLAVLPNWGIFYAPISFVIFLVTIFAETNRLPFDLAESEGELVAGFLTEYGAIRWSLFFMGEYAMMFVLSVLLISLFLGGYELPYLSQEMIMNWLPQTLSQSVKSFIVLPIGIITLILKTVVMMWLFIQVRFTVPRFRFDQLMKLGWMYLLPIALVNLAVTALLIAFIRFR